MTKPDSLSNVLKELRRLSKQRDAVEANNQRFSAVERNAIDTLNTVDSLLVAILGELSQQHDALSKQHSEIWAAARRQSADIWHLKKALYFPDQAFSMQGLNGQFSKQLIWQEIQSLKGSDFIIETGSYLGATTEFLGRATPRMVTIEINAEYAKITRDRTAPLGTVEVLEGSSVNLLPGVLKTIPTGSNPFIYLDAHWYNYLPLRDEIVAIFSTDLDPIVMIDDFRVEGDEGYGHDHYASGEITREHILDLLEKFGLKLFFPSLDSRQDHCLIDTIAPRGTAVLVRSDKLAEQLSKFNSLTLFESE